MDGKWQRWLDRLLGVMIQLGDVLTVLIQTLIVSFGVLVALVGLLWVEQSAVSHGVGMFEVNLQHADIGALVIVIVSFAVKFLEVYAESSSSDQRKKFTPKKQYAFSFRLMGADIAYLFGFGKKWQKRELPISATFVYLRNVLTVVIMLLAFFGRTHEAVLKVSNSDGQSIDWQQGLRLVSQQSTLADLIVWIGAIAFTFAAVIAAQRLTHYTAVRVIEIRRQFSKPQVKVATVMDLRVANNKPRLAFEAPRELSPIKVKVGKDTRYKCPQCDKVMTRQGWQKHPCRFTEGYSVIDDALTVVDGVDIPLDDLDMSIMQPISKTPTTSVNGRVNHDN